MNKDRKDIRKSKIFPEEHVERYFNDLDEILSQQEEELKKEKSITKNLLGPDLSRPIISGL